MVKGEDGNGNIKPGPADSGGEAKTLIAQGRVLLNGTIETQIRKKLAVGDKVKVDGHTIIVQLA